MKLIVVLFLVMCSFPAFSQYTFMDPVSARTFNSQKYSGVRGTPFLLDDWTKGVAYTSTKIAYKDVDLKLDVMENVLFFKDREESYEFRERIVKFVLMPNPTDSSSFLYFQNGFSGGGVTPKQYLQILTEGQLKLCKLETKMVQEMSEINAGMIKTLIPTSKIYLIKDGNLLPLKLNKDNLISLMREKESIIVDYCKQNTLSFKKEMDVIQIVNYYNKVSTAQ